MSEPDMEKWCAYHCVEEEPAEGDIVCGECWHRYRGEADVVATEKAKWGQDRAYADIYSCPLCIHDF